MYRGFNVEELPLIKDEAYYNLYNLGKQLYDSDSIHVRRTLNNFVQNDNKLDGTAIQNAWFPQIEADIFLSHSHNNLELALVVAGWMRDAFGLKTFIDSCVWGYGNELLRMIDNKYCFIPANNMYSYQLRNHSTAHVHMMLSTALSMMIDKSECLFFLNTPDSIKSYGDIDKTESPWIYAEIAATQILRQRVPERIKALTESFSGFDGIGHFEKAVDITYKVDLNHLKKLTYNDIMEWRNKKKKDQHVLDTLYELNPVIEKK